MHIETRRTPWRYLEDSMSLERRGLKFSAENLTNQMKAKWPGEYRVVEREAMPYKGTRMTKWVLEFDDPAEETMFRLKWS